MSRRFYPAVLERDDDNGVFAVWFPDFPGCVAAGPDQEAAIAKAHDALAAAMESAAERDEVPEPTALEAVAIPADVRPLGVIAIGVTPANPSERVNVYLPKALIERMDQRATELGMSRSSFVGFSVSRILETEAWVWVKSPAAARGVLKRKSFSR